MLVMSDYYELLQIPRNADEDAIKKAYRRLARQFHPDSNKAHIASEHMKLLNAAYDVLSDPAKRHEYDDRLAAASRRAAAPSPPSSGAEARPRAARPTPMWMVWLSVTGILILATTAGTLFVMRDSVLALLPQIPVSATRIAVALATPAALFSPTPVVQPTITPRPATATPGSTRKPPTPAPTITPSGVPSVSAYPVPVNAITGTKFVFNEFVNGNGPSDIFVSNASGTLKANLTHTNDRSEVAPSWAPFGQRIVFSEFATGNLFVMNSDGTQPTRVSADPDLYDSNPVWAPVGSLIATVSTLRSEYDKGNTQAAKIYVVDFGSKTRRLVGDQPGKDITWSPDAKWLAYQVPSSNGTTIYIAPVDRSNAPPFFFAVPHVRRMAWTLDSKQLVYEAFTRDSNHDGVVDERDQSELFLITLQPLAVQPLSGHVTIVSPRGRFPGSPTNGEFYPPVTSIAPP